jgi:Ca-activated chloride channel family protein
MPAAPIAATRRCTRTSALLALALLTAAPAAAFAQLSATSEPWTTSARNVIVPQRSIISVRPGGEVVQLSAVKAEVVITDQVAVTTLDITVTNPTSRPMETELVLPVPDGATVKGFQLDGLPNEGQARILPREEARRIYESIVRQTRDPGLVEFLGYSLIRSSVFPVPANGSQRMRISYEQVLKADGQRVDYVLPRSDALARSGVEWSATISFKSSRPISTVYSPSHNLALERRGPGDLTAKVTGAMGSTVGSLRLSYLTDPARGEGLATTVLCYPDPSVGSGNGGYFLLLAGLPSGSTADTMKTHKELTFVIDRSGSMQGGKIEQAKRAAIQVLEGLDMGETFNIIDYSDTVSQFSQQAVVKSADSLATARSYISALQANGGTNLHDALLESLRSKPVAAEALPMVLFLTDGLATVGQTAEATIRDNAAKANTFNRRVFTVGVGYDVNVPLLTNVAMASKAASTFVLPEEDVEVKVSQVFRRLAGPVLTDPKITFGEPTGTISGPPLRDLMPQTLPDVFEGDQIIVLGVYTGSAPAKVQVRGKARGKDMTYDVTLDPATATNTNSFVPRLWANRRIGFLNDQITALTASTGRVDPNDPRTKELIDEIVRLSTKWGILTEYTAFLADDTTSLAASTRELSDLAAAPARAGVQAEVRSGKHAVAQEMNKAAGTGGRDTLNLATQNCYVDGDMKMVRIDNVQQCGDQTLFFKNNRWVDARVYDLQKKTPNFDPAKFDQVVKFGTSDYFTLASQLATEGRQALLAQSGEIEVVCQGKRVLVQAE